MNLKNYRAKKLATATQKDDYLDIEDFGIKKMDKCSLKVQVNKKTFEFKLPSVWLFCKEKENDKEYSIGSYAEVVINDKDFFRIYLNYWNQKVFISDIEYFKDKNKPESEVFSVETKTKDVDMMYYQFNNIWEPSEYEKNVEYCTFQLMLSNTYQTTLYSETIPNNKLKISIIN